MKNIYTFIACMIIACNSLFAQLNDVVSFNVNQLKFTTVDSYKKVAFDDCSFTSQIGAPELPYLVINYVIPFDKRVASITISDSTNQAISGTYMIYPAQPQNPINEPPPAFVEPISSIYSSNTKYPSTVIEIASQQYDKGYHIVTLHIYPLSYIPKDKRLSLFTNIAFILNYENEANPPIKPKSQSEFMYNVVRNQIASMVKNSSDIDQMDGKPQRIVSNSEQLSMINSSASSSDNIKPIYIIITNNTDVNGASVPKYGTKSMTDIFNELAIWKTKKGVPTVVVTVDEIKEQTTGCDLQEQIHNFLKDIWIESGTTYILFGGDVNIVPVRFIAGGNYGLFPSDLYYTAVESDWNANGNNIFGENNGDKSDITSEFYFGRAAVENGNEANTFVSKVLEYEKLSDELGINQDYVNNYLFMAAYITVDRDSTGQINYVSNYDIENVDNIVDKIKLGSNKWRLYDEYKCEGQTEGAYSRDDELNSINVINNLNDGQPFGKFHIAYHLDHSGYNGMGTSSLLKNETLYRDDMDNLSNNSYWQILYTNGCSPGEFDKDCIVERYLNNPNGGGVAAMASSDASYASERKFFENILKHIGKISYNGPANFNIGIVHNSSLELLGNTWEKRKNHLFGDPEMPIWTETPKSLDGRVSLSSNTISNVNTSLTVTVSNIDTKNVNVCLSKNGDIYEIGWTLSNSQSVPPYTKVFNFELDPQTPGNLDITVTAHNYIPYETSIPVNITGNNLYVSGNSIMDVNGNSNQQLDAGETANLNITLKNNGTTLISDVDVRLQCLTSDVIVDVNSAEYGDIAKNSSATRSDFRITLPSDITAGEVVNFKLYITGSGDYRATKKISYKVGSAEIKAIQNRYTQSGNTYTLFVDTFNSGSSDAVGVKGTLSAVEDNSSGTTIETSTVEYGTIKRLKTKNSTTGFKFTASPYSNQEFVVTFKDKYGKTWTTQPFNLVRPTSVISNISFTSTERSISLIWKPIPTNQKIIGYNVYRSLAENGTYTKLNPAPFATASMYSDNGLTPKTYYYYRISYVDNSGNESAMSSPTMAWTTLPFHDGWPIENSAIGFRISGSPNVIDIDNDGKKELFFAATSWGDKNIPAIFGFKHNGEELYDIDNNPTTLSGFAKFDENTYSTPALADIDNDGKIELVVSTGESGEKTYAYKITNIPNSPQLMWQTSTGESLSGNVVLAPFKGVSTSLEILPTNCYKGINQTQPILDNIGGLYRSIPGSAIDESGYKSGMHAVADIDNDGKQEIVMGHTSGITYCRKNAEGNYAQQWQYSNSTYPTATSPIVLADMDDDGSLDILFLMYNNLNKGVICIMRSNKTFLPGWDANNTEHIIDVKMPQGAYNRAPYISVGDVNSDGMPEVVIGGLGRLYAWKCNGVALPNFPITVANFYMGGAAPILADIDGEGDIDIICSSFDSNNLNANKIYAFHANGEVVKGFPLNIENSSTPCVADIDNDGKNELMARGSFGFYVWDTNGDANKIEWGHVRGDERNTGTYRPRECPFNSTPMNITNTQTWTNNRTMEQNIVIKSGAKLTIKGRVEFATKASIIVERGGNLVVDGGTLTNACIGRWRGIEVWGTTSLSQSSTNTGIVTLNNATIENAETGVILAKRYRFTPYQNMSTESGGAVGGGTIGGGTIQPPQTALIIDANYSGGRIIATNSRFVNNKSAVEFYTYGKGNGSSFVGCTFEVNKEIAGLKNMVYIGNTNGVSFKGVDFLLNDGGANANVKGVYAVNSSFNIFGECVHNSNSGGISIWHSTPYCPNPAPEYRSSFTNFEYGIYATGNSGTTPYSIKYVDFKGNNRSIYSSGINNISITDCEFDVLKSPYYLITPNVLDEEVICYGLYCNASTGYQIEDNSFIGRSGNGIFDVLGYKPGTYGIIINNSGTAANKVYRNSFSNLEVAAQAQGNNKNAATGVGLCFACNDFNYNRTDIAVVANSVNTQNSIAAYQYNKNNRPAANGFTPDSYSGHAWDIYNYTNGPIVNYMTFSANADDRKYIPTISKITPNVKVWRGVNSQGRETECPPTAYNPGMELLLSGQMEVETVQQELALKKDGGNTREMITLVQEASANDVSQLNQALQDNSPYLSNDVVLTTIENEQAVNNVMLRDVLVGNSHAAREEEVLNSLNQRATALPSYMYNQIDAAAQTMSGLDILNAQLQESMLEYNSTFTTIAQNSIANDSIQLWEELMENAINNDIRYGYAVYNALKGNNAKAEAILSTIDQLDMSYNEFISIMNDSIAYGKIDETAINSLLTLSEEDSHVGVLASNILNDLGYINYQEPIYPLETTTMKSSSTKQPRRTADDMTGNLSLYPNPAKDYITVEYNAEGLSNNLTMTIVNIDGKTVKTDKLIYPKDSLNINIKELTQGSYILNISSEGNIVHSKKFIINK